MFGSYDDYCVLIADFLAPLCLLELAEGCYSNASDPVLSADYFVNYVDDYSIGGSFSVFDDILSNVFLFPIPSCIRDSGLNLGFSLSSSLCRRCLGEV